MSYDHDKLIKLLKESVSPWHTVLAAAGRLEEAGFEKLEFSGDWDLKAEGKYYTVCRGSSLFAFTIGKKIAGSKKLRIAAAHTDFPGFAIKNNPDMEKEGYRQINTEVYGGPILNTWLDRPLSAAGRVALASEQVWEPEIRLVDLKEPFCVIPNLAIHMNREVNKGLELNRQRDLMPVAGLGGESQSKDRFMRFLAEKLQVEKEQILDFELRLYCAQDPVFAGMDREFILAPHLDNTTSIQALLDGIGLNGQEIPDGIRMAVMFDHEEIGSRTKQGAASMLLRDVIGKIAQEIENRIPLEGCGDGDICRRLMEDAIMLSVDVAHGLHPNHGNKMDPTNRPVLGKGLCIKEASSQSYATDSEAVAVFQQICRREGIPWQKFVNRSDQPGGSTLGAVSAAFLPVPVVDIGIPLLAMHSAVELMGKDDMEALSRCITAFFLL